MVFHCRCFSFLLQEDIEYETKTHTKSTATDTFYTAHSDPNRSEHNSHARTLEIPNSAEKRSNLRVFTVVELKAATKNFRSPIGDGGFGSVYKGVIKSLEPPFSKIPVAVKRFHSHISLQGRKEWETEINVLGAVEHPNLVKLIGYCADDDETRTQLLLVYEYMVNGSVEDHLYAKSKTPLSWNIRLKVAQDAARGLTYLHEELDVQIVLRDFKPSNILLDDQWNAKLADFGLAMLRPQQENSQVSTRPGLGTMGYIAPEYFIEGHHTFKSDVWSYSVFLYELITGRRPIDRNLPLKEQMLIEWVKPYVESKRFNQIVDPRLLKGNYPLESAEKLSIIADKCLSANPKSRPKMSEVLEMVNQLVVQVPSQATYSAASPLVPQVAADPNKTFMGPNQGETTKETKHKGQKGSMKIQLKKHACMPWMRPLKLLKSCSKKSSCVSLH